MLATNRDFLESIGVQAQHCHALALVGGLRPFATCGRLSPLAVSRCLWVSGLRRWPWQEARFSQGDVTLSVAVVNTGGCSHETLSSPSPSQFSAVVPSTHCGHVLGRPAQVTRGTGLKAAAGHCLTRSWGLEVGVWAGSGGEAPSCLLGWGRWLAVGRLVDSSRQPPSLLGLSVSFHGPTSPFHKGHQLRGVRATLRTSEKTQFANAAPS